MNIICPNCNSEKTVKDGILKGHQRYLCKECGKRFNPPAPRVFTRYEKECPMCGHKEAKKTGHSNGKQVFMCLNCNHKFVEGSEFHRTSPKEENMIISLQSLGVSQKEIAERVGVSQKTVYNVLRKKNLLKQDYKTPQGSIREFVIKEILSGADVQDVSKKFGFPTKVLRETMRFEYEKETLSQEQKGVIYKFGVECGVPVEYLAPYVPCSQRICKSFLKKFNLKDIERKKYIATDIERVFDKIDLDRFIK